jgi:hypothetical protein
MWIDPLFARLCSLSRPASLDLERFTTPSKNRRFTSPSILAWNIMVAFLVGAAPVAAQGNPGVRSSALND